MRKLTTLLTLGVILLMVSAAPAGSDQDVQAQLQALQQRVAELEAQQNQQALQQRNAELIREMVAELAAQPINQSADTGITAGYDKRFFIKTTDDQFRLEFDTLLKFGYSYLNTDDNNRKLNVDGSRAGNLDGADPSGHGFELETARLYLQGHVLKDIKYAIALEGDDESGTEFLYSYELSYSFMPEFGVKVGKFKAPFGKQETTSESRFMLVNRSLANEVFNLDRCVGVEVFGELDMGEVKPVYQAMVFNNARQNENAPYVSHDNAVDLAGRLMVPLMGASVEDFENESDLEFHDNPVAMVGCSLAYLNDRMEDTFGGGGTSNYTFLGKSYTDGILDTDGRTDIYQFGGECEMVAADVSMKYQGLSVTLEGFYQHIDVDSGEFDFANTFGTGRNSYDPITGRALIDGYEVDNWGWYAQAGYFIVPKKFELVSRISDVCVDTANDSYEYCGGWNWYLSGQDLKLSMDVTYIDDLPLVSTSPNFYGVQNNSLFLIRTQLQFQF
ncbi:MAG: hypothetical protein JW709_01920 [Sedimentisphaerales bacterium]|nr:hypothetical protein [Sedimentisphaerales bacterium]